jgi:hypothetical protein
MIITARSKLGQYLKCPKESQEAVAEGQCFHLRFVHHIANIGGDLDAPYALQCEVGTELGVDHEIMVPQGLLRSKLQNENSEEPDILPHSAENYPSATEPSNEAHLLAQYKEDVEEGMALGPFKDDETLAQQIDAKTEEICYGALAVRDEIDHASGGMKKRTLHDGTIAEVNTWIQAHIQVKGDCPMGSDCIHAMALEKKNKKKLAFVQIDARKAHRRMKLLKKDWK